MKAFKMALAISALSLTVLAGCSNGNSATDTSSSSSHSNYKQGSSKTSSSQQATSSSNSSASASSSSKKSVQITNQEAGVMAWKLANYKYFAEQIKGGMYYGTNTKSSDAKGYDFITANGDVSSVLYFKVHGNQLTYRVWDQTGQATLDGHYKSVTVSLQSLVDQFYSTPKEQSQVQADVKGLMPYRDSH